MKLIYIGRINLPKNAASIRVYNVGAALKARGHQVDYICQEGTVDGGITVYEGSTYYGLFDEKTGKLRMFMEWLSGNMAVKCLKRLLKKESYDGVILYNTAASTCRKVLGLCKKRRMAVINDVTEWYETGLKIGVAASAFAWSVDRRIRYLDRKCAGVIAISPYLENYYRGKVPVINLPPVFGGEGVPNSSQNERPRFLYAGSPSKKDELFRFLQAVKEINRDQIKIEMTLIGAPIPADREQLLEKGIRYLPRMSHEAVLSALGEHDFTVILRRPARYAKAGYSTKVAESLHNGTPVFCNEIGGADTDIENGVNGIKLKSADVTSICEELINIHGMSKETRTKMKNRSFEFGRKKYSRQNYEKELETFFLGCISKLR